MFSLAFKYYVIYIIHIKQHIIATLRASATSVEQPIYFYSCKSFEHTHYFVKQEKKKILNLLSGGF